MTNRSAAYIGVAGVLAYDYKNPGSPKKFGNISNPNPILENVPGLLICYDDLYFLSREFCPRDMLELPYVHFVNELEDFSERAEIAYSQYVNIANEIEFDANPDRDAVSGFDTWEETVESLLTPLLGFGPDHHTHGVALTPTWTVSGSGRDPRGAIVDLGTALALDKRNMDVILSSVASSFKPGSKVFHHGMDLSRDHWRTSAASSLVEIATPSYLGVEGAYHPAYEELRSHKRIVEFRDFLKEVDAPHSDGKLLANEVVALADNHASNVLERFVKGKNKFRSVGIPILGGVLNSIVPGVGSAISGGNSAAEYVIEQRMRNKVSWAPFVLDLRRGVSGGESS
ncbi:hypothetical protein ACFYT3_04215 [Nocardia amikacinitolerans]|uniref:hypothetical protein n=1 Tax=Nocardia amikacinitolerans TaxID=756689 RepID=UPI0036C3058A